ncbi:MAG: ATP synthase F1 subunit epsilon [Bacteroidetes bacterium]|nr:ATP synthase F1 subunit epsilon [Bacteroidota bacterium]MCL1968201.1 ATP synthase F1 subunit epsilon [Bacteroidota bacterium]
MNVEIITPDKEIFSGNISLIQLPGLDGLFEILENHADMVAALKKGKIKLVSEGKTLFFEINGGTLEVVNNKVQVLAE